MAAELVACAAPPRAARTAAFTCGLYANATPASASTILLYISSDSTLVSAGPDPTSANAKSIVLVAASRRSASALRPRTRVGSRSGAVDGEVGCVVVAVIGCRAPAILRAGRRLGSLVSTPVLLLVFVLHSTSSGSHGIPSRTSHSTMSPSGYLIRKPSGSCSIVAPVL